MQQLIGEYYFREMKPTEFEPLFMRYRPIVFQDTLDFRVRDALSVEELTLMQQQDAVFRDRERIHIGLYHRQREFIGWHVGEQYPFGRFYMTNTGILPEHQNKGIYTALLPIVIEMVRERGYQRIFSRHVASNNAVLVPKLKAGFQITSIEIDDQWGVLLHLTYFFNPLRRKALAFRTGETIPDAELRPYLSGIE